MKHFVRSSKLKWNLSFWALFFTLIVLQTQEIPGISLFFTHLTGVLLIVNRIYLIKGRIKRRSFFLSLLALFFIMVILTNTMTSRNLYSSFSFVSFSLVNSYFTSSAILLMGIMIKINHQVLEPLNMKITNDFVKSLIFGFLFLITFYPFVVLHIKRLRDIKLSYWWILVTLIPGIHIPFELFLCFKKTTKQSKR